MSESPDRRKLYNRRLLICIIGGSVLVFAGITGAYYFWDSSFEDEQELERLKHAPLVVAGAPDGRNDWPQWRGPTRSGISAETELLTAWPKEGPPVLWQQPIGEGYSSFAVAGGRVFTMTQDGEDEAVVCWDADTGEELWRFRYPCRYLNSYGNGPRSTPTVDGTLVYTVGATGLLHCLKTNPQTSKGEKVWGVDLLKAFGAEIREWGVAFSPLIEGDLIYTNPGGPDGNSLVALNKFTGDVVWKNLDDTAGFSSPIAVTLAGERQILFLTATGLTGVSPETGELFWRFPWETPYDCNIATPIAVNDYVFISSDYNRGCALVRVEKQGEGSFEARRVYENRRMRNHFSSCVFIEDHLYGFDQTFLTCMEFRTGRVCWKQRGFKKGSLVVADGRLIILGGNGKLAVAEASPEGYREQASFRISTGKCWTLPVPANGRLYVRDANRVVCLDLRTNPR